MNVVPKIKDAIPEPSELTEDSQTPVNDITITNQKFEHSVPVNGIDEAGQERINSYLRIENFHNLPGDWDWSWIVSKGEYAGTLPKRISKFFRNYALSHWEHETDDYYKNLFNKYSKISPAVLSEIGNIAKAHTVKQADYIFDFASSIDWSPDDFGDYGSCYWTEKQGAKQMLMDNSNPCAIRFYGDTNSRGNNRGIGRAWLARLSPNEIVIFNAYGPYSLITIARVLSDWLGLSYHKIQLGNRSISDIDGVLWINYSNDGNGSRGIGYRIAPPGDIVDSVALGWEEQQPYDNCYHCNAALWSWDDGVEVSSGANVCGGCYEERYTECDDCGDIVRNVHTTQTDSDHLVCESCIIDYIRCYRCDNYHHLDDIYTVFTMKDAELDFCQDCITESDKVQECEQCNTLSVADHFLKDDICIECSEDSWCNSCGLSIQAKYMNHFDCCMSCHHKNGFLFTFIPRYYNQKARDAVKQLTENNIRNASTVGTFISANAFTTTMNITSTSTGRFYIDESS